MAPIFATANISTDANQLTMEVMKKWPTVTVLPACCMKSPSRGVNGSSKHNNWSLSTDGGENLLDPGTTPAENTRVPAVPHRCDQGGG